MIKIYLDKSGDINYEYKNKVYPFAESEIDDEVFTALLAGTYCSYDFNKERSLKRFQREFPDGLLDSLIIAEWSPNTGVIYVEEEIKK